MSTRDGVLIIRELFCEGLEAMCCQWLERLPGASLNRPMKQAHRLPNEHGTHPIILLYHRDSYR
jgi:hypothetical protein